MNRHEFKLFCKIIRAQLLSYRNYWRYQLDRITRIEIVLFGLAAIIFLFERINVKLYYLLRNPDAHPLENFINGLWLFFFLVLFGFSFERAKRNIISDANLLLLQSPLKSAIVRYVTVIRIALPTLPVFLIFVGALVFITWKTRAAELIHWHDFGLSILILVVAIASGLAIGGKGHFRGRLLSKPIHFAMAAVIIVVNVFLWIGLLNRLNQFAVYSSVFLAIGLSHVLFHSQLQTALTHYPESLWRVYGKAKRATSPWLLDFLLFFVPRPVKPLVRKDYLYAYRNYKSFFVSTLLIWGGTAIGIILIPEAERAAGWSLFVTVAASYVLANMAFRFNDEKAESVKIIKMHALRPPLFWRAKFFNLIAVMGVFEIFVAVILFFRFDDATGFTLQYLLVSSLVCFTISVVQTNFALYSYSYARYAPLWFNIYIIVAVLFFTVFLFPPLTIAFTVLGFAFVVKVLKRMAIMEVY